MISKCSPRIMALMATIAELHGLTPQQVRGPGKRSDGVAVARRQIAAALRAEGHSLPSIGRFLGGIHHTTVLAMLSGGKRRIHPQPVFNLDEAFANDSGWWAI